MDQVDPRDADLQLDLADGLLATDSPEAATQVRHAAALASGDALRLTRAATQLLRIGDNDDAGEAAMAAAEIAPPDFEHVGLLGNVMGQVAVSDGRYEHAERLLEAAFDCDPENPDFGYGLAAFHRDRGHTERAREVVLEALAYNPDDEWLLSLFVGEHREWDELSYDSFLESAFAALEEGNPADAEVFLRHADERFPGDPDVQLGLADALLRQEDPRAAEQVRRAAALAGNDPHRLMRAAYQAFHLGDWPATAALTAEARRIAPEDFAHAAALMHLAGSVALHDGDDELAEQMLERAFERAPDEHEFAVSLVDFLAEHGSPDRAYDVVEQALERHPGDEWLLAMREYLLEAD